MIDWSKAEMKTTDFSDPYASVPFNLPKGGLRAAKPRLGGFSAIDSMSFDIFYQGWARIGIPPKLPGFVSITGRVVSRNYNNGLTLDEDFFGLEVGNSVFAGFKKRFEILLFEDCMDFDKLYDIVSKLIRPIPVATGGYCRICGAFDEYAPVDMDGKVLCYLHCFAG